MDYYAISRLIYRTCWYLNDGRYEDWLAICNPKTFRYVIKVYSPEISKDMTWLDHDFDGIRDLFAGLKQHATLPGSFHRHVGMVDVADSEQDAFKATSSVIVYYTTEAGATDFFALIRYEDCIMRSDESFTLSSRVVRMNTRVLPTGPHVIL